MIAGTGGVFDIHVDGELVFYKKMLGRYPDPDDVLPLIREHIGPEVMRRALGPLTSAAGGRTRGPSAGSTG